MAAPTHHLAQALHALRGNGDVTVPQPNGGPSSHSGTRVCSHSDFLGLLNMLKENAQNGDHLRTLEDIEETLGPLLL